MRPLDYDNLVHAFKNARDAIADFLIPGLAPGQADSTPGLSFQYQQEKSKEYYIEIHFANCGHYLDPAQSETPPHHEYPSPSS